MHELVIDGITVKYPFIPYDVQKDYMQCVIQSLENGENAALESPTGTGKTLCLLCSALAWIEQRKEQSKNSVNSISDVLAKINGIKNNFYAKTNDVPLVIYASRTHSQLLQAMKELKRSAYGYMKAGVVASRDQLCIHPKLKMESNANKILKCKKLRAPILDSVTPDCNGKRSNCNYYDRYMTQLAEPEFNDSSVLDIEDLVRIGKKLECCPYFAAKQIAQKADILFMPYNYLLDPKIREINQIDLRNAIIILDEAHNVAKVCEESACTKIRSTEISIAIRDTQFILDSLSMQSNKKSPTKFNEKPTLCIDEVGKFLAGLNKLRSEILNIDIKSACLEDSHPGGFIFELFEKADINEENHDFIIDLLQRLRSYLSDLSMEKEKCPTGIGLQALLSFLQTAYSSSAPDLRERVNRAYKVYIQYEPKANENENENKKKRKRKSNAKEESAEDIKNRKIINFWCFSAEFGMNYLQRKQIRCLILTSGTLSPLDSLINELQIPIPITLSNKHVINNWQIFGKIIEYGPDNRILNSNYGNRTTDEYMLSLGKTILEYSKVVPEGLLVFFSAYAIMDACIQCWESNGIYSAIDNEKRIFIEPRTKNELRKRMTDYYAKINEENSAGAIFMAVLRGKVSEGLDFADMYGRGVIITGLPFGPVTDPKVILKKKYLDENRTRENRMLSGWDWYSLDAIRAVNQAIGRVIRHKNDYGAIFLCDIRFLRNKTNISSWIKNELTSQQLGKSVEELQQFYEQAKQSLPEPTPIVPQIDSSDDEDDHIDTFMIKTELNEQNYESSDSNDESGDDEDAGPSTSNSPAAGQQNSSDNGQVTIHRKKLRYSDQNENGECSSDELVELNPILKNMERELGTEKYHQLVQIWSKYDSDENYESFRDSLFHIFGTKEWIYNLKGFLFLTKKHHRADLDKDIEVFISGLQ